VNEREARGRIVHGMLASMPWEKSEATWRERCCEVGETIALAEREECASFPDAAAATWEESAEHADNVVARDTLLLVAKSHRSTAAAILRRGAP
jgi:hypothetical protein